MRVTLDCQILIGKLAMRKIPKFLLCSITCVLLASCGATTDRFPNEKIEESCRANTIHVARNSEVSELYVNHEYLHSFMKLSTSLPTISQNDLVRYLFKEKLNAIETETNEAYGYSVGPAPAGKPQRFVRISIQPNRSRACEAYRYAAEYPQSAMPWLRTLGLQTSDCVAVEHLDAPQATTGIYVRSHPLSSQLSGGSWQRRLDIELVDTSTKPPTKLATVVDHLAKGGGGKAGEFLGSPCKSANEFATKLRESFTVAQNARIQPPTLVMVPPHTPLQSKPATSDEEMKELDWLQRPGQGISVAVGKRDGTVWIGGSRSKDSTGDEVNILTNGKIYATTVWLESPSMRITGLAETKSGFAFVLYQGDVRAVTSAYLTHFDRTARNISVSALSRQQYAALAQK